MSNLIPAESRRAVEERSGGLCERCVDTEATDMAHRMPRNRYIHTPENVAHLCHPCHDWCHANPEQARGDGWILPANSKLTADDIGLLPAKSTVGWVLFRSYRVEKRLYSYTAQIDALAAEGLLFRFGVTKAVA